MARTKEEMLEISKGTRFKKGTERSKNAGHKGGISKSHKKAVSARVRFMRDEGYTPEQISKTVGMLDNPELSVIDIQKYVNQIKELTKGDPKGMDMVASKLVALHKLQHGEKKNIDIRSVNLNVNADSAMTEKFMAELEEHFS